MKRKCFHIKGDNKSKKLIYVDEENSADILEYLQRDDRHREKFNYITELITKGFKNRIYTKEDIDKNCKDVYAMRFFIGQENDRIYCKEVKTPTGIRIVIASVLYEKKKSTTLNSEQKNIIRKIAEYEYEI